MEQPYGKLILVQEGGPEQEYELGKASVTLGRAMTNDIIISDARASRSHARLDCRAAGCTLVDLGSANGTRVNGMRVEKAELNPGDVIHVGNTQFRFEMEKVLEDAGLTMIDSESDLDRTLDREFLPMSLNETGIARLVIFTGERTWEVQLEDTDQVTIGRTEENMVVLEQGKVSRKHAEVVRKNNIFILRDLGSTNGTWFHGERVDELILQDGDVFRIGESQLVYKSGFGVEALTMADDSFSKVKGRRPVIFIPGTMGSELWLGNERIWPNVKVLFRNPEIIRFPSTVPLEARAVLGEVVVVPNLIKLDQYNRLGDYLVEELGYERGKDFYEFAYDWRQDVRISARELGKLVETLPVNQPITIIAHSLGTMVSRHYTERLGGKQRVERAILMGGPHNGSVKILTSMLAAPEILPFGLMGERFRQITETFPSAYQIIPPYACGIDQNGNKINFLEDESWLKEEHVPMLRAARKFRQDLGKRSSIPTLSIFGYGLKTTTGVGLKRSASGRVSDIVYKTEPSGDSTILEMSAVLEGTEIHPVQQYHGSLFVDNDVKMRLKLELARQFST